ncbi:nucleoside hydrolase [Streptomyces sp. J2-1]|uniref:nucleoside hydrolase n=1 Tax=Streptomyces corallincola TaxID=2851888 RepID=UPI001C383CDA|nr:nucleoside hydrolase [Streptomyces corallincola]MBV2357602.1 nucleoside hydrolase [Streptomyces corallincola]
MVKQTSGVGRAGSRGRGKGAVVGLGAAVLLLTSACGTQVAGRDAAHTATVARQAGSTAGKQLVVYDNDWTSSGATSILPLLANPKVKVLGTTVVTGDGWAKQGTADALSFFEKIGRRDVPVSQGFTYPLINSPQRAYAYQKMYGGGKAWLGAFNRPASGKDEPATGPDQVTEPPFGWAKSLKASKEQAVDFLIDQVRAHPHQVTIVTAGPLTNIAGAVRKDPRFASLAKGIVIGGGNLYQLNPGEKDKGFNSSEGFNFRFDPEAAHIVLTAGWKNVTALGDVTSSVMFDKGMLARIKAHRTAISDYVVKAGYVGYPLWDETTTEVAADPTLVRQSIPLRMDVDMSPGPDYGATRVWSDGDSPGLGEAKVRYVQTVDDKRVADTFVAAATR